MDDIKDLIKVKQPAIIEERLRAMQQQIEKKTSSAMALICTAENLQTVKALRTEIRNDFAEIEEQRKAAKEVALAPWNEFEAMYKLCISEPFRKADADLKSKVSEVEDGIKATCEAGLREYFTELCEAEGVQWLTYERAGIVVDMTSARQKVPKKLREKITQFVTGVSHGVSLIAEMDCAEEIMVEFKRTLDAAEAISIVQERHRRVEAERVSMQTRQDVSRAESVHVVEVKAAEEAFSPPSVMAPVNESQPETEKCYVAFKVTGTLEQIIALKKFLMDGGYQYEQLGD